MSLPKRRLVIRTGRLSGDVHGSTKITDVQVREMRSLWKQRSQLGLIQEDLARRYGITQAQVSRILNFKRRNKKTLSGQ